jgi:hypothetical protein
VLKRAGCLLGLSAAVALTSSGWFASSAGATNFGTRLLVYNNCCNGELLYGTKASIYTPPTSGSIYLPTSDCLAARSDAESGSGATQILIQTGWVICAPGSGGADQTCSLSGNLVQYVEIIAAPDYIGRCYPKGAIGYNVEALYTVRYDGSNTWYAWIAGVQDSHPLSMGAARELLEGMEWTGSCSNFHGQADYGIAIPWQRYQASNTWYQVQSSSKQLDCNGAWTDYGAPPFNFAFYH